MNKQIIKVTTCALFAALCMGSMLPATAAETVAPDSASKTITTEAANTTKTKKSTTTKKTPSPIDGIMEKIAKTQETYKNKDLIAWLTVTGTGINEPIAFSKKSNFYYLYRDFKGTEYRQIATYPNWKNYPATVTYLDYRTKIGETFTSKGSSHNYVLYGHNWNNLSEKNLVIGDKPGYAMFAQLPSYSNKAFAEKNPYIYFSTGTSPGAWKVLSVAYAEVKFNYNSPNLSDANALALMKEWKSRSIYNFSTDIKQGDRFVTLSTCTRQFAGVGENQRFVVVARLLREGESTKDPVTVEVNNEMKKPKF